MSLARAFFVGLVLGSVSLYGALEIPTHIAHAQTASGVSAEVNRIRDEITARNDRLQQIQTEIAQYQKELEKVGAEKSTLQSAINKLELERKKVLADLSYTQNQIGRTDLEIQRLDIEIGQTEDAINRNRAAIEEIIRRVNEADDSSLIETLLANENLSDFWEQVEELEQVRSVMGDEVRDFVELKDILEGKHHENQETRGQLVSLKDQYEGQREVLEVNKKEKNQLLAETQNEEATYQKLLAEKRAAQEQILKELRTFEAELKFVLDPTTIPTKGTAVFNWPLASIRITQYFGGTEFAKQNASVYAGRAYHPGVDFGTPSGTKIMAPLAGTVRATGNTDAVPGCYSWGKWTLIDHANGLSTLYAHQNVISVVPGQKVATGEVIGYSGNTGYSTGPHLHFTVYAQDGVTVRKFNEIKTVTSCGPATTPVAATDAYIDPMLYLPAI